MGRERISVNCAFVSVTNGKLSLFSRLIQHVAVTARPHAERFVVIMYKILRRRKLLIREVAGHGSSLIINQISCLE